MERTLTQASKGFLSIKILALFLIVFSGLMSCQTRVKNCPEGVKILIYKSSLAQFSFARENYYSLIDLAGHEISCTLVDELNSSHENLGDVTISPDGQWLLGGNNLLRITDGYKIQIETSCLLAAEWGTNSSQIFYSDCDISGENKITSANIFCNEKDGSCVAQDEFLFNGSNPTLSFNGERLAYETGKTINIISISSGARVEIEDGERIISWSPSTESIMYSCNQGKLCIDNMTTSSLVQVDSYNGYGGIWSPDGSKILYYCNDTKDINILLCTMNSDGGNTNPLGYGTYGVWSPDGKQVVFNRRLDGYDSLDDICTVQADGTNGSCIAKGKMISQLGSNNNILFISSDSSELRNTIQTGSTSLLPTALFSINQDGTNKVKLTSQNDEYIIWYRVIP